jgi:hypothetical protein
VHVAERGPQQLRCSGTRGRLGRSVGCLHRLLCRVCGLVLFGAEVYLTGPPATSFGIWRPT